MMNKGKRTQKKDLKKRLAKRVESKRLELNLSKSKFALKCKLARNTILKIEQGTNEATLTTLARLADGLDITIAELTEGI